MIEHLLVTGEDYTVVATVVEPTELEGELTRMADRLRGVTPTRADLAREEPRIQAGVDQHVRRRSRTGRRQPRP